MEFGFFSCICLPHDWWIREAMTETSKRKSIFCSSGAPPPPPPRPLPPHPLPARQVRTVRTSYPSKSMRRIRLKALKVTGIEPEERRRAGPVTGMENVGQIDATVKRSRGCHSARRSRRSADTGVTENGREKTCERRSVKRREWRRFRAEKSRVRSQEMHERKSTTPQTPQGKEKGRMKADG